MAQCTAVYADGECCSTQTNGGRLFPTYRDSHVDKEIPLSQAKQALFDEYYPQTKPLQVALEAAWEAEDNPLAEDIRARLTQLQTEFWKKFRALQ